VVIDLLAELDLAGERIEGLTGVWLEGKKVAALGVGAKRWISQHGLALNVSCSLEGFAQVVPCGLADRPVGRLIDWRPQLSCHQLRPRLVAAFARQFDLTLRPPEPHERPQGW
jgi:lipoyl(octanoyl) transferase